MSADESNSLIHISEAAWLNDELQASGLVTARLIGELEGLVRRDQELNQKLITVLKQSQNPRPLYLAVSNLLGERANAFTQLSTNTKESAELCRKSADAIDKKIKQLAELRRPHEC
jgi:hypothetical protein